MYKRQALRDVPGVSGVEAAYSADVLATLNDEQYVMRVHSLLSLIHI